MKIIEEMKNLEIGIQEMANAIGVPYYDLGEMLFDEITMPLRIKEKIKFFLIKNYTERIENILQLKSL